MTLAMIDEVLDKCVAARAALSSFLETEDETTIVQLDASIVRLGIMKKFISPAQAMTP